VSIKSHNRMARTRTLNVSFISKEIQRFEGPAVLDMKWSHPGAPGGNRLAISNAEGQITVHRWNEEQARRSKTICVLHPANLIFIPNSAHTGTKGSHPG
jgi:hypothetical protein